ncbi:GNAT family N-acetyltransferase [Pseudomaricurvus alkylphenolicus]|jgi:N-acetylglutamate synthase-like GNAT family acetyltransferase|uniref:GNAT family N-acetyltransferase n=1 Tax=Pseudomaricurvus alkylphenolicus TaxID=1306991 RepID=UPI0014213C90|nr:GNAT family N-acetyltransferase [Pseudomaricurvus alkylphenolicus]NIB44434.1 GNAT family N-acetyltransferase [Pseudomaricurvus alkylphenolicus]
MNTPTCELLDELQLPLVNKFYKRCRYSAKAGRGEKVYVLRDQSGIVAAVRLEPKPQGYYFLRSMCVDPALRRQGLGAQLLKALTPLLEQTRCYCYPFDHLQAFYAEAGFEQVPSETMPDFIRDGLLRYRAQGRKILLMVRPPA